MNYQSRFQRSLTAISPMPMNVGCGHDRADLRATRAPVLPRGVLVGRLVAPAERVSGGELLTGPGADGTGGGRRRSSRFLGKSGSVAAAVRPLAGVAACETPVARGSRLRRWCSGFGGMENAVALAASLCVTVAGVLTLLVVRARETGVESGGGASAPGGGAGFVTPASSSVKVSGTNPEDGRIAGVDLSGPF